MNPNQNPNQNTNQNPNQNPWNMPTFAGQPNPLFVGHGQFQPQGYNPNPSYQNYASWGQIPTTQFPPSQPQPQMFSQSQSQPQTPVEEDDDVELVPETQAPEPSKKTRRRGKEKVVGTLEPQSRKKWDMAEELDLVRAYVDTSEDPKYGNSHKKEAFWSRVSEKFHEIRKSKSNGLDVFYRNNDKLSSKWFDIKRKVGKFHGIVMELKRNRPSGSSDVDFLNLAIDRYRDDHNSPPLMQHYEILNKSPKFHEIMDLTTSGGKKRSSTDMDSPMGSASTGRCNVDLNDAVNLEDDEELAEMLGRPVGKKKAIRQEKEKKEDEAFLEQLNVFNQEQMKRTKLREDKIQIQKEKRDLKKEKIRIEQMRMLSVDTSNMNEEDRQFFEREKEKIRRKLASE